MALMEVLGEDKHSVLFDSGGTKRTPSIIFPEGYEDREGQSHKGSDCKEGNVYLQTTTRIGNMQVNKRTCGTVDSEEKSSNISADQLKVNGSKDKVRMNYSKDEEWVSVFIGNLPPIANNRWIFDNFIKIGKVTDYFVSGRLSKYTKKSFGFVRFQSLEDANRAVAHFNGVWLDGFKLEVELARFPRRMMNNVVFHNFHNNVEENRPFFENIKDVVGRPSVHNTRINPNKTFAQVLLGSNEVKSTDKDKVGPRIKVKAVVKECGWLNVSVVAKIKWGVSFGEVMQGLLSNIKGLVSVSRLGVRKVILTFSSVEDRMCALRMGDWMGLVEEVREWRGEVVCGDKLWKISCIGIPIIAWNTESFRSIAEIWGSMVNIDCATIKGMDYSVANFVIEAESEFYNTSIDLLVGNEVFQVKVTGVLMESQPEILGEKGDFERGVARDDTVDFLENNLVSCSKATVLGAEKIEDGSVSSSLSKGQLSVSHKGYSEIVAGAEDVMKLKEQIGTEKTDGVFNDDSVYAELIQYSEIAVGVEDVTKLKDQMISEKTDGVLNDGCASVLLGCAGVGVVDDRRMSGTEKKALDDSVQVHIVPRPEVEVPSALVVEANNFFIIRKDEIFHDKEAMDQANFHMVNGSLEEVDKEVEAMMDLGNNLDIPNASFFEEAVTQATLDEAEEESKSIGARVKSKRKYSGKSKIQFGCRLKKG